MENLSGVRKVIVAKIPTIAKVDYHGCQVRQVPASHLHSLAIYSRQFYVDKDVGDGKYFRGVTSPQKPSFCLGNAA